VSLSRFLRRFWCLVVIGAVFISHGAAAAYVCPEQTQVVLAQTLSAHHCLESKTAQTSVNDGGLCHASCLDVEQVAQEIKLPTGHTVAVLQTYPVIPTARDTTIQSAWVERTDIKTKEPSRSVLFCCFRN
jgi:hypothetical protein